MARLLISFERSNARWGSSLWLFPRRHLMRFEWFALLALKRLTSSSEEGWMTWQEIARLPSWSRRTPKGRHHIETNVGRYLRELERNSFWIISSHTRWTSPYRLDLSAASIDFDIPLSEVRKRLRIRMESATGINRDELFRFTASYVRSQWLMFQGRLLPSQGRKSDSAHPILMTLAGDNHLNPQLRLVACLGAVQVLFRSARFGAARKTLLDNLSLMKRTADRALKAQFYLALAWSYQRGSSGVASDRNVEKAFETANAYAEGSVDRATVGLIAHRTGGYLTKKGMHEESVNQHLVALGAALITANYDMVQASCGNIGSVIHRLGLGHYKEARRWLLLGIAIARSMKLGREDAHGEMILAKMYIEQERSGKARLWLERATRIASRARNQLNLADIKMTWGLWHKHFGSRKNELEALITALNTFRSLRNFDYQQKENYMERQFPEVWQQVLEAVYLDH